MNNVPHGYKRTEVGVIPDDWEVKSIAQIAPLQRGFDLPTTQIKGDTYPVVYSNGVMNFHDTAMVRGPGVVTGRSGTLGKVHYIDADYWPHNTSLWVTRFNGNVPRYIFYLYTAIGFERFSSGSGVPTLNRNDAHTFRIALPPTKAEQQAIVEALSDADALIESLEQLTAKKRQIKQGAMQELLTGKWRLPGFAPTGTHHPVGARRAVPLHAERHDIPDGWEVKPLGEISPLQRGFDLPHSKRMEGSYPVVYSNGILNHHNVFQVKGPGVVTGRSGTIGAVTFVEQDFWPHNTSLWVTSFKGNDPKFIFYLYTTIGLERFSTGSGVPTLNRNDVHAYMVKIPVVKAEQTAIATILSDMDAELAALEIKLTKARQLKQGMMQELLTGRIRLL